MSTFQRWQYWFILTAIDFLVGLWNWLYMHNNPEAFQCFLMAILLASYTHYYEKKSR